MMGTTTVAVMTAAFLGTLVPAGHTAHSAVAAIPFAAALHEEPAPLRGRVSGISVSPATGGADVVIALDSGITVRHFLIDSPSRLVVDLGGASLSMRGSYDGQSRGPVRNVRLAQYRSDTVRVVESRPLSRTKRWRLLDVVERAR